MRRSTWISVLATVTLLASAGWFSRLPGPGGARTGAPRGAAATASPASVVRAGGTASATPTAGAGFRVAVSFAAGASRQTWDHAAGASRQAWDRAVEASRQAWDRAVEAAPGVARGVDAALQKVPTPAAMAAVGIGLLTLGVMSARARDRRRAAEALLRRGFPPARVAGRTRISRDALRTMARARRR